MQEEANKTMRRYDRVSAIYDIFEAPMEMVALKQWRKGLMDELYGNVLEVGVGTGKNIEYYPKGIDITGIDFSQGMLKRARQRAEKLGKKVELLQMDAQSMDFSDNTFDTVFTTCVFCSVPDPVIGLKEIRRVCKESGRIILIEHVRSEKKLLGLLMDVLNPVVVNLYGANINRRTVENVRNAGFADIHVTDLYKDIVKKIVIQNFK
ncbi:MAG TPA: class I SAM-dependent methyltransferase [Clostridia bacterium]|nr:class I SAM-dependent methyltransferase [Clostridia bacterium]